MNRLTKFSLFFGLAALLMGAAASTSLVYKYTGNNTITGNLVAGTGTSITATGSGTIVATSLSGGVALTNTYVGYGAGGALSGEAAFNYTAASNLLTVDNLASNSATALTLSGTSGTIDFQSAGTNTVRMNASNFFASQADNIYLGTAASPWYQLHVGTGGALISVGKTTSAATDLLINPTTKSSGNLIDAQVNSVSKFSVDNAGAVSLGNTVNSVSPTAPNRTVTIVINGTTYYLHAKTTND